MARIALTSSFKQIPEGQHVFYVYDAQYDETFGQLDLYLFSETTGDTHRERFFFLSKDGEPNETSMSIFSYLAHVILDDFEVEDVDPVELIGHRFVADIAYQEGTNKNGQKRNYARLDNKSVYDGRAVAYYWDDSDFAKAWYAKQAKANSVPAETQQPAPVPAAESVKPAANNDVNDLLASLGL